VTGALSLLLPAALAAYFLYQAIRRPIFLLGIPFMQVMARSVFFWELRPFRMPVALGTNGVILMWMALAWIWCLLCSRMETGAREPLSGRRPPRLLPEEYLLVALAVLVLGKILWGGIVSAGSQTVLGQFAPWGLLLVGYFFVRGAVRRSSSQDVAALLLAVAAATGIASVLFILHQGLGISIYSTRAYQIISFGGQKLTRTYWIMSPFLLVSLAVGATLIVGGASGRQKIAALVLAGVSLVAVLISYTRNYVLAAAAVIAVLVLLRWLKERRLDVLVRRSLPIAAVLACVAVVLVVAMPASTAYLLQRMGSVTNASKVTSDENLLVRQSDLIGVGTVVYGHYPFLGAPFGVEDDFSRRVADWIPDSTWTGVLYWTGFVGLAIVGAMFVLFGFRALSLFLRTSGSTEFLAAVLVSGIVALFINSLTGWSFLDESVYAMGFWLFAFVTGETLKDMESDAAIGREEIAVIDEPAGSGKISGALR